METVPDWEIGVKAFRSRRPAALRPGVGLRIYGGGCGTSGAPETPLFTIYAFVADMLESQREKRSVSRRWRNSALSPMSRTYRSLALRSIRRDDWAIYQTDRGRKRLARR